MTRPAPYIPLLAAAVAIVGSAVQAAPLTDSAKAVIETAPAYPAPPVASATGRLAWVRSIGARTEIWDSATRGGPPKLVATYDDRRGVGPVAVSADGRWLAYQLGRPVLPDGEVANIANDPDPVQNEIIVRDDRSGARHVVATGKLNTSALFIEGDRLYYVDGSELWAADLRPGAVPKPERLLTIRGALQDVTLSPDRRSIAFASHRSTHSFVGIIDLETRQLRYLAPEISYDFAPRWSPDGTRLVFLRDSHPVRSHYSTPVSLDVPWSIMLADVASGTVRKLWTADKGMGAQPFVAGGGASVPEWRQFIGGSGPPVDWIDESALAIQWEKSGFNALYRLGLDGKPPVLLTPGSGEIVNAQVDRARRRIVFLRNSDLPERFDLWAADLGTGRQRKLLEADVELSIPGTVVSADGCVLVLAAQPRQPSLPTAVCADGTRQLQPAPDGFPHQTLVEPEIVTLRAEDGALSRALLFRPRGKGAKPGPALVYVHGGPSAIQTVTISGHPPTHGLVASGYTVLAVNYRGNIGYGAAFREAPGAGAAGGTDVLDAIAGARYLAKLPDVDPSRIGIYGGSYGGFLTTAAIAREPRLFGAGASLVGVIDWTTEYELDWGRSLPVRGSERLRVEDSYFAASANSRVDGWRTPLLLITGDEDTAGWTAPAVELGYQLRARGVHVEALVDPGGNHHYDFLEQRRRRVGGLIDFFDRMLKEPATTTAGSR